MSEYLPCTFQEVQQGDVEREVEGDVEEVRVGHGVAMAGRLSCGGAPCETPTEKD